MTAVPYRRALIVGAGPGLGASLARVFANQCGMRVAVAARRREPLEAIAAETGAVPLVADASKVADVGAIFDSAALALGGAPDVVVYNASQRVRGPFVEVDAEALARAVDITVIAAFRVAQQAVSRMLPDRHGAVLFTGASPGSKDSRIRPRSRWASLPCVASRRAWRGNWRHRASMSLMSSSTAQSVPSARRTTAKTRSSTPTSFLLLTCTCLRNPRSAWSWEIEVRPWVEHF